MPTNQTPPAQPCRRAFRLRRPALSLSLLVPLLSLAGCGRPNEFVPPPPPEVTVAPPVAQEITPFREFTGRFAPVESVELRARVPGFLDEVHFSEGTLVAKGDLLYTIEAAPYEAALKEAQAALARAKAAVAEAEFDLEKTKDLRAKEVASNQELVIAQAKYDSAVADQAAAEAAVASAEIDLSYTKISAPITGHINQSRVDPGNLVGQGEPTLLTTIVPWDPIHAYFNVNERDVLAFRRQQAASNGRPDRTVPVYTRLADGSDYEHVGQIDYVDNRVDPDTGTIGVRALFPNPDEVLVPGIFARIRIPEQPRATLLVPEVALQRDMAGYFVLTVDDTGTVARQNVQVGNRLGSVREITHGLSPEDGVIINGLQRARPGITVQAAAGEFDTADAAPPSPAGAPPATQPSVPSGAGAG